MIQLLYIRRESNPILFQEQVECLSKLNDKRTRQHATQIQPHLIHPPKYYAHTDITKHTRTHIDTHLLIL